MKKINILLEEKLTKEGLFDGIQVTIIKHKFLKHYNKSFEVNYLHPLPQDKMKSDRLELHFSKNSKGIVLITVDDKLKWESEEQKRYNKFRKKRGLPLLKSLSH